jgi:hypothetical protein
MKLCMLENGGWRAVGVVSTYDKKTLKIQKSAEILNMLVCEHKHFCKKYIHRKKVTMINFCCTLCTVKHTSFAKFCSNTPHLHCLHSRDNKIIFS